MIIPIYKPIGKSTHLLAKKVGDIHQTKATHTGTLDPMADGVVVVLTGEDRFKKDEFTSWKKTYEFEVLWGIITDSLDLLGLIKKIDIQNININYLNSILPRFIGQFNQQIPDFSAQRIQGQSYFDLAKRGERPPSKHQDITIHDLKLLNSQTITPQQLFLETTSRIQKVEGDFRQEKILNNWQKNAAVITRSLTVTRLQATTSKRTYIRSLVRDIAEELQIPATTFSITRTQNGPYRIKDCSCLI